MKYEMQFCVGCYLPNALSLAQSLLENSPHDESFSLTLLPGEPESFDVRKDDTVVYSKKKSGRLPTAQDLGLAGPAINLPIVDSSDSQKCC